ncbi:MAG: aldolase [Candidatus Bipolaricaulota bacterium]|nr:MAG: aldolase [Candidatus Bipolaricaulota bacterium]
MDGGHPRVTLRATLASQEVILGTFVMECTAPGVPRILADAGFDFVVIDAEHGVFAPDAVARWVGGARAAGIAPLVRVPEITRAQILRALEAGAEGIVAPMVESSRDAEELYRLAMYPPLGERGTCLGTAHSDYTIPDAASYLRKANETTLLVGQIETRAGVEHLDSILESEKLDVAFIGPLDLSVSLGTPGDQSTPDFAAAIERVLAACTRHGVVPGAFAVDSSGARDWIERGFRAIACSADILMLADKSREIVDAIRRGT